MKAPGTDHELLVEIQTGSFAAMGKKLDHLLPENRILLIHPVAVRTTLDRLDRPPRRSPKRGSIYSVLDELVSIPTLLDHPNLSLEVVLIHETRKQIHDPQLRRRRGGYRTVDRHVDEIVGQHRFDTVTDLAGLLPTNLAPEFTTADVADAAGCSRDAAQKLAFCLRAVGLIEETGRTRAGYRYRLMASRES